MTGEVPHILRADARENRDRVLDAARALFSERGLDVTMREIARHAGVGPATLYRRFPAKQALVEEVFSDEVRTCHGIVRDGCADADPWRGFCSIVERATVLGARNQGFIDAFAVANPQAEAFTVHRAALLRMVTELSRRAQAAGGLRRDFVVDDLVLVLLAGRTVTSGRPADRVAVARRFAALAIEAFRASADNAALPRVTMQAVGR